MKLRSIIFCLAIIVLMTTSIFATNTNPVVTNVIFGISGTTVTVHYDVTDAEQSTLSISMEVSSNNGTSWDYNYGTASGAIGSGVSTGTAKTITWTYSGAYNNQFMIKIIANDLVVDGSPCATATVIYAGKTYNTVQIGSQCWLKENLNVGTRINGSLNQTNNSIIEKYCYNDDTAYCTTYGGIYQWAEAVQYQNGATNTTITSPPLTGNVQGICPTGWHLPTSAEFTTLATTVNNDGNSLNKSGQGTGTNTSGFTALLAGCRNSDGTFYNLNYHPHFQTTLENSATDAYYLNLNNTDSIIGQYTDYKVNGFSVRCVKD